MDLQKIQDLTKEMQLIEKKIAKENEKHNEKIELLKLEFEEKSDELTTLLNL